MNKSELIDAVAGRLGENRAATNKTVDVIFDEIQRAVTKGERVALTGFGVFEKRDRAARIARNPATGATVKVKKTSVPAFRPGQGFKDVVSGARKLAKVAAPAAAASASTGRTAAAKPAAARKTAAKATPARGAAKPAAAKKSAAKATPARSAAKPAAAKKTAAKPAAKKAAKKASKR